MGTQANLRGALTLAKTRLGICLSRFYACHEAFKEGSEQAGHGVSLIEIPGWMDEIDATLLAAPGPEPTKQPLAHCSNPKCDYEFELPGTTAGIAWQCPKCYGRDYHCEFTIGAAAPVEAEKRGDELIAGDGVWIRGRVITSDDLRGKLIRIDGVGEPIMLQTWVPKEHWNKLAAASPVSALSEEQVIDAVNFADINAGERSGKSWWTVCTEQLNAALGAVEGQGPTGVTTERAEGKCACGILTQWRVNGIPTCWDCLGKSAAPPASEGSGACTCVIGSAMRGTRSTTAREDCAVHGASDGTE